MLGAPPYIDGPLTPLHRGPFANSPRDIAGTWGPAATTMFGRKRSVSFGGFGWWVTGRGMVVGVGAT